MGVAMAEQVDPLWRVWIEGSYTLHRAETRGDVYKLFRKSKRELITRVDRVRTSSEVRAEKEGESCP